VVELGVWVAAPATAALLADWGADVIKVEPPAGDPMRHVFGSLGMAAEMPNPAFALDNRGKRSVVLDLRTPEGRAHLEDLLGTADVFISNLRPDALDALDGLGLEPEATVARHPRLVYCSVSGYGLRGDDHNRPTYDIGAFWARSGLAVQMADGDGNPLNARGGIGDHVTGLASLAGVLAAVLEQRHTGRGRVVEASLLRTGAYVLGWDLGLQMAIGRVAGAEPRHRNQAPLMNPYRTADGRWFFFTGLEATRHLGAVGRALDRPDLLDDPRFADASSIRRNRVEVIAVLDEIVARRTLAEWAERFEREGVWWAPARTPAEVVDDRSWRPTTASSTSPPAPPVGAAIRQRPHQLRPRPHPRRQPHRPSRDHRPRPRPGSAHRRDPGRAGRPPHLARAGPRLPRRGHRRGLVPHRGTVHPKEPVVGRSRSLR
jgi:crotonobetainyl-CoA:carnitine CoA-transferase CaiB-like acyl-CoA transferase